MATFLLMLPDLLLIVCGFLLSRHTALDRSIWAAAEKLVYHLLFPALLFGAIVRNPLSLGEGAALGLGGLAVTGLGVAAALALGRWPGLDARLHASGAQVAFRFNSYVALALAERLAGGAGVAAVALLVALCVPLCNVAAVWPLARQGQQGFGRELARNPLILSTGAGLLANLAGLQLPEVLGTTLQRIGSAALPLGLMAVGAGLQLGGLNAGPRLAAALLALRHLLLPAAGLALALLLPLSATQRLVLVVFAALPTASSCYVLAVRMGGDGPYTAGLVTLSTALGMLSLPLWTALATRLGA